MKKIILSTAVLLLLTACSTQYTFNGLICPVDDPNQIQSDLASCKIYDLDAIDKSLKNEKCKACIESKGYRIDSDEGF